MGARRKARKRGRYAEEVGGGRGQGREETRETDSGVPQSKFWSHNEIGWVENMELLWNKWNNGKIPPCFYPRPPLLPIIASLMVSQYFVVLQYSIGVGFETNSSVSLIMTMYWCSRKATSVKSCLTFTSCRAATGAQNLSCSLCWINCQRLGQQWRSGNASLKLVD